MIGLRVGAGGVAAAELFGQVFGEVADAPFGVSGSAEHALGVELRSEPGHIQRLVIQADRIECVIPGRQQRGCGVDVPLARVPAPVEDDGGDQDTTP